MSEFKTLLEAATQRAQREIARERVREKDKYRERVEHIAHLRKLAEASRYLPKPRHSRNLIQFLLARYRCPLCKSPLVYKSYGSEGGGCAYFCTNCDYECAYGGF